MLAGLSLSAGATELAGLHAIVGAFLFGAALAPAPKRAGLALLRRRGPALAVATLLPLFFAVPALSVDVWSLGEDGAGLLGAVLVVAVVTKVASAAVAARLAQVPPAEALTIGALMNARGLVELVVLAIGLQAGLIDERLFSVMVLMALVTTFATGPLVSRLAGRSTGRRTAAGAGLRAAERRARAGAAEKRWTMGLEPTTAGTTTRSSTN